MINWYINLAYPVQALIATIFTWAITSSGAAVVFLFKKINKTTMDAMLGLSAGVMLAATFWSLLSPALEMAENLNLTSWIIVSVGVLLGGLLLFTGDKIFDKLTKKKTNSHSIKRSLMLIFSITLHNIPEGMAVGVIYAGLLSGAEHITEIGAFSLALGIAIQNFPEGAIISLPLCTEGMSKKRAFIYGVLSGAVEPVAAVFTVWAASLIVPLLPYFLSFAAGAMFYVVVEELIPEMFAGKHSNIGTILFSFGFTLMLTLDVALG